MAELVAYPARFDFGRLFADTGRVFVRAGGPIALGVLIVGAAPVSLAEAPWWRSPPGMPADAFQRIWVAVTMVKVSLELVAYSATTAFVTAASLKVLSGLSWREALAWPVVGGGFAASLALHLLSNWPLLVSPLAMEYPSLAALRWLFVAVPTIATVPIEAFFGVAVAAAAAERLFVGAAMVRSFRLLRGLRWRMVGLTLAYLLALGIVEYATALALALAGVSYFGPGAGRAVIAVAGLAAGALTHPTFVSIYLQARRIADGPSAGELQDVFA